ncbi:MAG: DUF6178 family protein [Desulfomonilaceae bacterium]
MKQPLSTENAIRIIETFDNLPYEQRAEIFRGLSPKGREELLEVISRPTDIIRNVSEEETFFTVKALGEENAPALITLTTGKQLLYLLDIDLWKKEMLDTYAIAKWLDILARIGEEKMLQFVQVADPELLLAAMDRLIKVKIRNPDIDFVEESDTLPLFTLDDMFYIEFRVPDAEEVLKQFLETLFQWNSQYYLNMLQELAAGLPVENEEAALKWRRARLADKGFPEFEEAVEIYHYLQRGAVREPLAESQLDESDSSEESRYFLGYPLKVVDSNSLFKKCLDDISDPSEKDRLASELAHLSNKVMVADGRDPASMDDLQGSLKKVSGYINIALEEMCGENVSEAVGLLRSNHMEILFRRGFSLILDLRKDAHRLVRNYEGGVENLGHPLAELLKGLFQKRPFYAGNVLGDRGVREFEQIDDIRTIREMMDHVALEESWESL